MVVVKALGWVLCVVIASQVGQANTIEQQEQEVQKEETQIIPDYFFFEEDLSYQESMKSAYLDTVSFQELLKNQDSYFLCVGESHKDKYRKNLVQLLGNLDLAHFFMEVKNESVETVLEKEKFLNASLDQIKELKYEWPSYVSWTGVEADGLQKKSMNLSPNKKVTRDGVIAWNIIKALTPGLKKEDSLGFTKKVFNSVTYKAVALYGASHCSTNNQGLGYSSYSFSKILKPILKEYKTLKIFSIQDKPNHNLSKMLRAFHSSSKKPFVLDMTILKKTETFMPDMKNLMDSYDYIYVVN